MERFIKEYANYKMKDIESNGLIVKEIKNKKIDRINKSLKLKENGLITIDEAIKTILEA